MDRRDSLAQLLTDDDVETLKHLAREGTGENTCGRSRRIPSNLPTWADAATGPPLLWPAIEALALKFAAITSGIRRSARAIPDMGCLRTLPKSLQGERLLRYDGPPARTPSSSAWRAGALCTGGKGSRGRSERRVCARLRDWPFAPRPGRASAMQAGSHSGYLGSVDRDLRDGSSDRYRISRSFSWRSRQAGAPQRRGAAVRRAAEG